MLVVEAGLHGHPSPGSRARDAVFDRVFDQRLHDERRNRDVGKGVGNRHGDLEPLFEALPLDVEVAADELGFATEGS